MSGDESRFAKSYIGDGVYASFDGYHIWLRTSNGILVTNEIAIEPAVYQSLIRYATRLYACCQFAAGDRVRYVPHHALEDPDHEDCEDGTVSSSNGEFVFVKFDRQVATVGIEGATAQGCDPDQLVRWP